MLEIYEYDDMNNLVAVLQKAAEVKVSREINGAYGLEFKHPQDEKSREIKLNRYVCSEGQYFRVVRTRPSDGGDQSLYVECRHVYDVDAKEKHLQNVPDFIGKNPYEVFTYVFSDTKFEVLDNEALSAMGLTPIGYDGFLMDFFSVDKTTPYDVTQTIIENCGKGEIYIDNYKIALVERIGKGTHIKLDLSKNLQSVSVERDMTDMVTRLYPYGYEDLQIGTVNGGVQYIDSPNAAIYGCKEGYRDYSDYQDPVDVLNRALWDFSPENRERIDVPSINISGNLIDVSRLAGYEHMKVNIGDTVTVVDRDTEITERIISLSHYPYEPLMGDVSIGRIKKDLFFYLNQMGKFGRNYKKASTTSGKVSAKAISGVVSADGVNVKDTEGSVTVLTNMINMSDSNGTRFTCGISGGTFVFAVYDKNGKAIYLSDDVMTTRGNIQADTLSVCGIPVTASGGALYIGGKKILTE